MKKLAYMVEANQMPDGSRKSPAPLVAKSVVLLTQSEFDSLPAKYRYVLVRVPWIDQPDSGPYSVQEPRRPPESEL